MCKIALTERQAKLVREYHPELPADGVLIMPPKMIRVLVNDLSVVENQEHPPSFWTRVYEPAVNKLVRAHNDFIERRGY